MLLNKNDDSDDNLGNDFSRFALLIIQNYYRKFLLQGVGHTSLTSVTKATQTRYVNASRESYYSASHRNFDHTLDCLKMPY